MQLPGLQEECKEFLRSTDIVDIRTFSKQQWKTFVGRKIAEQNKQEILTMMSRYKKITPDDYKSESCEVQPYIKALNIKDARLRFKLRAKMTPSVKMNFMSDPVYSNNLWTCEGCSGGFRDTQSHILICEGYSDLRCDKNLDSDKSLVDYFDAVIKRRMNI